LASSDVSPFKFEFMQTNDHDYRTSIRRFSIDVCLKFFTHLLYRHQMFHLFEIKAFFFLISFLQFFWPHFWLLDYAEAILSQSSRHRPKTPPGFPISLFVMLKNLCKNKTSNQF
jgi:hypothetical protein